MESLFVWGDFLTKVQVFFIWMWSLFEVKFMVAHIVVNFVVALAATIVSKEFVLARVGEFLYKKILPYVLVYAVFRIAGTTIGMPAVATAVWAVIEMALLGDLTDNLKKLGLKLPEGLGKRE